MTYEYFGVVTKLMSGDAGLLRGLARFENGKRDPLFRPERHFEPAGNVFIDRLSDNLRVVGVPVHFDAELNPHRKGSERWWVTHDHSRARIALHGFSILNAAAVLVDAHSARPTFRNGEEFVPGSRAYLRYETNDGLVVRGPWTVRAGQLHAIESELHEWPDGSWPAEVHFESSDGPWEVLLAPLDPSLGRPFDQLTGDELLLWFLSQAETLPGLTSIVGDLRREGKKLLKAQFREFANERDRWLFEARFARALSTLETVELGQRELQRIAESPAFRPLWSRAVETKAAELENEANARMGELRREEERAQRSLAGLQQQKRALEVSIERLRAKEGKSKADLTALKRSQRELESHVGENQQRLVKDSQALALLLPDRRTASGVQPSAVVAAFQSHSPSEGARREVGPQLVWSDTVRACRLTLLPDPFRAREVARELDWNLFVFQVEPHWLSFEDSWNAGFRAIFLAAVRDGEGTLLHLQDLDRSPPELWLRPILDLASGLRDQLLEGESGWPETLRVTASLAPGPPHQPLCNWLLRHFAAPAPFSSDVHEAAARPPIPGVDDFAEREAIALGQLLARRVEPGNEDDLSRIKDHARQVRWVWPLTFARRS